jgi:hypothetical protein
MRFLLSFYSILLLSTLLFSLDPAAVDANKWIELMDGSSGRYPNYGNWSYENDFNADPNLGLAWISGGHRMGQDAHYYVFDPITEKWTSPNTPLQPGKG